MRYNVNNQIKHIPSCREYSWQVIMIWFCEPVSNMIGNPTYWLDWLFFWFYSFTVKNLLKLNRSCTLKLTCLELSSFSDTLIALSEQKSPEHYFCHFTNQKEKRAAMSLSFFCWTVTPRAVAPTRF